VYWLLQESVAGPFLPQFLSRGTLLRPVTKRTCSKNQAIPGFFFLPLLFERHKNSSFGPANCRLSPELSPYRQFFHYFPLLPPEGVWSVLFFFFFRILIFCFPISFTPPDESDPCLHPSFHAKVPRRGFSRPESDTI